MSKRKQERHGMSRTPEYRAWWNAKLRCFSATCPDFHNYGGRGVSMCVEWRDSFAAFFAHIGPLPGPGYSLDRINNDGNYEPGNVRWATRREQAFNTRRSLGADVDRCDWKRARWRAWYLQNRERILQRRRLYYVEFGRLSLRSNPDKNCRVASPVERHSHRDMPSHKP
jgi:hypothetical protein